MKPSVFHQLKAALGRLSAGECLEAQQVLNERERQLEAFVLVKELTEAVSCCPHCKSQAISKAGSKGGRKRFKCDACHVSFNALTGTPLAGLRMIDKHAEYARCMIESQTVRRAAKTLAISLRTSFRWRHRFLAAISQAQPAQLAGIVEADETYFRLSFKGSKHLPLGRKAKKRGTPASQRGLSKEQIPVLVARDRSTGDTLTERVPSRWAKDIGPALLPRLAKDAVLCSDGASAYRIIAKKAGIEVKSTPAKQAAGIYHIQNVNSYTSRLKGWMFGFMGVATKYLHNYLGWHRLLDSFGHQMTTREFLLASFGNVITA